MSLNASSARSINELSKVDLSFPIIADPTREIAKLYDMLDEQDLTNLDQKGCVCAARVAFRISR